MKKCLLLAVCLIISGCLEIENSSSSDSAGLTFDPNASAEFIAANDVLVRNCSTSGCHFTNFGALTEDQFVAFGARLVIPGDPNSSPVYCRNIGSAGGCNKNMPQSPRPVLSQLDLDALSDWITTITP